MRVEEFPRVKAFAEETGAPRFADRFALLDYSLEIASTDEWMTSHGHFLEFGVHRAISLNYIAERVTGVVYGFDSFTGIKEDWTPMYRAGHFKLDEPPRVRDNVKLIIGRFQDTLESFLNTIVGPASFIHLDADLYSSTRYVLFTLAEAGRIVPGTVLQFDEMFWKEDGYLYDDEYRAFREFEQEYGLEAEWLGYCGSRGEPVEGAKFALRVKWLKH